MAMLKLEEILAVKYLLEWEWSADAQYLAYLLNDGGIADCWLVSSVGAEPVQLTQAKKNVTGLAWHPSNGSLAVAIDGGLWLVTDVGSNNTLQPLLQTGKVAGGLKWSPDGKTLSFVNDGQLWCYQMDRNSFFVASLPGKVATGSLCWSPNSKRILYHGVDDENASYIGVCDEQGALLWRSTTRNVMSRDGKWLNNHSVIYAETRDIGRINDYYMATLQEDCQVAYGDLGVPGKMTATIKHLINESREDKRGGYYFSGLCPNPQGSLILLSLELDGWLHHYLYDVAQENLKQVTFGQCEDFAQAGDVPAWSPDGTKFAYASNRGNLLQRHIWVYDVQMSTDHKVIDFPVTNAMPKWSPDGKKLAFLHCDYYKNGDLWVLDVRDASPQQLTFSMPCGMEEKMQKPEHITYKGGLNWDIDGFVFKPADFDATKKYPGIVWVHGGPIRQLRGSWHPSEAYAHFYAYNQYLASKGYVVMEINFRGGIGYGADFRFGLYHKMGVDDVTDVVNAGKYLKALDYVDEHKVAVYGLSYGGYMTLHALTQYPEEFCMGINIAGIWDFAQWTRWIEKRSGRKDTIFSINFGGSPEESPMLYAQGSPVTFKEGLKKPLINFHGTKDANVDFEQMDRIVNDCVALGKTYEAYYYPGEAHFFTYRRTWEDVFPKMEREFEKYLK